MEIRLLTYQAFGAKKKNPQERKLIPASEFKGPILQLTNSDKEAIAELQKQKTYFEVEHYKLTSYVTNQKIPQKMKEFYGGILFDLETNIESIERKIRDIKKARYQQQLKNENLQ